MFIARRKLLLGAAAFGTSLTWRGTAFAQDKLEDRLVVRTTGGAFEKALQKNFFEPFTRATGTRVVPVSSSYGEMIAKTTAMAAANAVEWDIISPQYYELARLSPYLVDLGDCSTVPRVLSEGTPRACGRYGVQYLSGASVLGYNPAAFPARKPESWADFWDLKNYPGRRALPSYGNPWANTLLLALLADGVAPNKLFPLDLDRAFRKLDEIKPHIAVWWKTGAQSQEIIRSGEVVATMMWSGTAYAAKQAGVPLEWTYNQAIADLGSWAILKGAPHPKAARAFIDFYMSNPENHAAFSREMGYATTNRAGQALLTPNERKQLVADKPLISIDAEWVDANRQQTLERWNKWLAS